MCGLIKQRSKDDPFVSELRFEAPLASDAKPAEVLLVFRRHPETGLPTQSYLRWGLVPHSMKARPEIQPHNARVETITEKRMFRDAYRSRRCVVPMDAFYERDQKRKLHLFALKHQPVFGVAGIWENWRNPLTDEWERTFAIITVDANELVARVHDRMPAILRNDEHPRWLGTEADPRDLLRPYPADLMTVQPVSRRRS